MSRIEVKAVETVRISAGDVGLEINVETVSSNKETIAFPFETLLGLISVASMAVTSIASRMGRRAVLPLEAAQVSHSTPDAIGLEVAFGQHGHLYFDLSRKMAEALHAQLENALSGTIHRAPPPASN